MMTERPQPSLDEVMQSIHPEWTRLPEDERGELLVSWLWDVLQSDYGVGLRQALEASALQTQKSASKVEFYARPTNYVSKEDLLSSSPHLAERIEQEPEEKLVDYVADKVGDALQEMYWEAVAVVLEEYFEASS